jgi:uncharacterized protein (DUF433 family)
MREYVEKRNTGLFVVGTRVALESVVYEFEDGASPESILLAYPGLNSLENVYGAITYYLANRNEVGTYLQATDQLWESMRSRQQFPEPLRQRLERAKKDVISHRQ